MGQIKRLLDNEDVIFPDDMDMEYQKWVEENEAELPAYEEHLADIAIMSKFA